MNNKIVKGCVSLVIYTLILTLFSKLILSAHNGMEMLTTLIGWSIINIFCRCQKQPYFAVISYGLTVVAVLTLTSVMLTKELTILAPIDKIAAEVIGIASGTLTKLLIGFVVWAGIWIMNLVVDNLCLLLDGKPRGFKKASVFFSRLVGPAALVCCILFASNRENKAVSKETDKIMSFAVANAPNVYTHDSTTNYSVEELLANNDVQDMIGIIKHFENDPLYTGTIKVSVIERDKLKKKKILQVGFGITDSGEIAEAIKYKFLPKGTKLPSRMTKVEADRWFVKITFPLYLMQVKEVLDPKIKLTPCQLVALVSFCHNLGKENLRTLIDTPGRLNDGNFAKTAEMILAYNKADGVVHPGLNARRIYESSFFETKNQPSPPAALEPPTLLVSKR